MNTAAEISRRRAKDAQQERASRGGFLHQPGVADMSGLYKEYTPKLEGEEKEYAESRPASYKFGKEAGRFLLGDVAMMHEFPSIKKQYESMPALAAGAMLTADTILTLPGFGVLKPALRKFGKRINEGLKVAKIAGYKKMKHIPDEFFVRAVPGKGKMAESSRKVLFQDLYKAEVQKSPHLVAKGFDKHPETVFKTQARKYGLKEDVKLAEADPRTMKNFMVDMVAEGEKIAKKADMSRLSWVRPVRKAADAAEQAGLGMYSKGYLPLVKATEVRNVEYYSMIAEFQDIVEGHALGSVTKRAAGMESRKLALDMSKFELEKAGKGLHVINDMTGKAPVGEIQKYFETLPVKSQEMIKAYHLWADKMWYQQFHFELDDILQLSSFDKRTARSVNNAKRRLDKDLQDILSPRYNLFETDKQQMINEALSKFRGEVATSVPFGKHVAADGWRILDDRLKFREVHGEGRLTGYINNYAQRFPDLDKRYDKVVNEVFGRRPDAGYTISRTQANAGDVVTDIREMVEVRSRMQANELVMKDFMNPQGEFAQWAKNLPHGYKHYMMHYVGRALGRSSPTDELIAKKIAKYTGMVVDPKTLDKTARKVTDLCYMGTLGMKPAVAGRNLFQSFIFTGTDIGGGWHNMKRMIAGYGDLRNKETVDYLKDIGVVKQYAPELGAQLRAWTDSLVKVNDRPVNWESMRDAMMWMFKQSEEATRLATGAAAKRVWEEAEGKFAKGIIGKLDAKDIGEFSKSIGLKHRDKSVQQHIGKMLTDGNYEGAKKFFINNVSDDVNFIYGKMDSPLGFYKAGAPGRLLSVFQSWPINYAELMVKWAKTGDLDQKMVSWVSSNAAAYVVMAEAWGGHTALHNTFFAVQPTMPIVFEPIHKALWAAGQAATGNMDDAEKTFKSLTSHVGKTYVPMGSEISSIMSGYKGSGLPGAVAGSVGAQQGNFYQRLPGVK